MPSVKRAALYLRVSTLDQHPETQIYDLQQMAVQRDYQIVAQYTDRHLNPRAIAFENWSEPESPRIEVATSVESCDA